MTFYSIIFGILFLGAFREFLRSLNHESLAQICESATLMLLIFSDVIYTSHVIQDKQKPYTVAMKYTDLGSFILLSLAVFALDPTQGNLFRVEAGPHLQKLDRMTIFWVLIVIYWLLLIVWNYFGEVYAALPKAWMVWVQPVLLVPFLVMLAVAVWFPASAFAVLWRAVTIIVAGLYFGLYKSYVLNRMQ